MSDQATSAHAHGLPSLVGLEAMISHSSHACESAAAAATAVHAALSGAQCRALLDEKDVVDGRPWREQITNWLDSCHLAVCILCPAALESRWVRYELSVLTHRLRAETPFHGLFMVYLGVTYEEANAAMGVAIDLSWVQAAGARLELGVTPEQVLDDLLPRIARWREDYPNVLTIPDGPLAYRARHHALPYLPERATPLRAAWDRLWRFAPPTQQPAHPQDDDVSGLLPVVAREVCRTPEPLQALNQLSSSLTRSSTDSPGHKLDPVEELRDLNHCRVFDSAMCERLAPTEVRADAPRAAVLPVAGHELTQLAVLAIVTRSGPTSIERIDRIYVTLNAEPDPTAVLAATAKGIRSAVSEIVRRRLDDVEAVVTEAQVDQRIKLWSDPTRLDRAFVVIDVPSGADDHVDTDTLDGIRAVIGDGPHLIFTADRPFLLAEHLGVGVLGFTDDDLYQELREDLTRLELRRAEEKETMEQMIRDTSRGGRR